jgi:hypothetical protein
MGQQGGSISEASRRGRGVFRFLFRNGDGLSLVRSRGSKPSPEGYRPPLGPVKTPQRRCRSAASPARVGPVCRLRSSHCSDAKNDSATALRGRHRRCPSSRAGRLGGAVARTPTRGRLLTQPGQLDRSSTELGRMWTRHVDSFRDGPRPPHSRCPESGGHSTFVQTTSYVPRTIVSRNSPASE